MRCIQVSLCTVPCFVYLEPRYGARDTSIPKVPPKCNLRFRNRNATLSNCRSAATPRRFSRCCHCQERHRQTPRQGVEARGPITIPCAWLIGLHATSPSRTASRPGTDLNVGRCGGQSETRDRRQASATHAVTRPSIHVHLLVPRPGARVQAPLDVWLLRALSRSLRRSNPVPTSQPSKERGAPWSERCGTTARSQGLRRTEVACKPTSRRPRPLRAAHHHPHLAHGPPSCRAPSRQGG